MKLYQESFSNVPDLAKAFDLKTTNRGFAAAQCGKPLAYRNRILLNICVEALPRRSEAEPHFKYPKLPVRLSLTAMCCAKGA